MVQIMVPDNEKINFSLQIVGQTLQFINTGSLECPVHRDLVKEINVLKGHAASKGFDLRLASGHRSFDQQLHIWNRKAAGERVVLDSDENPIDIMTLSPKDRVFAILRWTALPGASRHHWGTDVDIYEAVALPNRSELQLTQCETREGGVFADFYRWLDNYLQHEETGFYRPYGVDLGGVAPEPWHLSYRPLSEIMEKNLSLDLLVATVQANDVLLKNEVIANIDEIYHRYVLNVFH